MHCPNGQRDNQRHVVIVGGGFAGLKCASDLAEHPGIRITLIDKNNYQQFHPLLYQVAASLLSPSNAAFSLRDTLRNSDAVDVQMDEVVSLNPARRSVTTASGKTHTGDILVLASGSQVNFFGTRGAAEFATPLYTLRNAEMLRSAILSAFEQADQRPETADSGLLNFVVVGGGPTGVEMAGTLSDMLQHLLPKEFRHLAQAHPEVHLVERGCAVLGAFSPASQQYAESALRQHGVVVRLGVAVQEVTPEGVTLSDGSHILAKTVIWAAGVKAVPLPSEPALPVLPSGRIQVDSDLTVHGFPGVYAIGDLANALDDDGKPLGQLAAVAKQAGQQCARNILASLGDHPSSPFSYADRGILAMIGRNAAVTELGKKHIELVGPISYAVWLGVHAALLTSARARMEAIVEWAWEYFSGERAAQLIEK